jgi:hypothetical protein
MRNIYYNYNYSYNYSYSALVNQREPNLIIVFGDNPEFSVPICGLTTQPVAWMMKKINERGYYGVAIRDRYDDFSCDQCRIIAKGRLLEYLRRSNHEKHIL